ncbi:MAG: L-threonylcarbamoyladenylate synthase [Actinomadura sp.]
MSRRYDCSDPMERNRGIAEAASAVRRGELVVLPTDTVYGIGSDAFTPAAVTSLLEAKGRGRDMPPPVLVGTVRAASALMEDLGLHGQDLIDEFWPGALTIVCRANPNLAWDLGDTKGTVAVRMPLHDVTLQLLKETGPLAVSSANLSGAPAARDIADAEAQLGDTVSVYLDAGPAGEGEASSIVDLTGAVPRLLRAGAISEEQIRGVTGVLIVDDDDDTADDVIDEDDGQATDEAAEAEKTEDAEKTEEKVGDDTVGSADGATDSAPGADRTGDRTPPAL